MTEDVPRIVATPPGPKTREILARQERVLYPGLAHGLGPFVINRKTGWEIEDVDGNVYLDFISAMASVPFGAARPDVVEPVIEALRRYGSEDTHYYSNEYVLPLAEELLRVAPDGMTRVDIALNGTEAVETAIRFMRRATGRPIVIGFMGGYHGEAGTAGAIGAETSDLSFGYRALMPGFAHVPYPNAYRTPFTARPGGTGDGTVDYIRDHLLHHAIDPREVAGFVIEPVLGSGGCVAPPDAFWTALVDLCREFDFLLCADEVKSGFGRTGHLFAVERWGVRARPDGTGQGDGRRRDADRRRARHGARDGLRRRVHGIDVVVAAGGVRRRARDAPHLPRRADPGARARTGRGGAASAGPAPGAIRVHRRRPCHRMLHRDRVRDGSHDEGSRPGADGARGAPDASTADCSSTRARRR